MTKTTKTPATKTSATKPATDLYRVRFVIYKGESSSKWITDVFATSKKEAIEIVKINWKLRCSVPMRDISVGLMLSASERYDFNVVDEMVWDRKWWNYTWERDM